MNVFVVRHPIFNRKKELFGYELLFRDGMNNALAPHSADSASSIVLTNSFFLIGMETLTSGKRGFIHFTHNLLLSNMATAFPKHLVAIQTKESVRPDAQMRNVYRQLKSAGYLLVLDDFIYHPDLDPLLDLVDIVKIDFFDISAVERADIARRLKGKRVQLLAVNVETQADFEMAIKLGYSYAQGYFFSKPDVVVGHDIPGYKLNYLNVIREINQPKIDIDRLEQIIQRDASLTFKLFRLINSSFFGLPNKIKSTRHALVMLGYDELRRWASLLSLSGMGDDKPHELAVLSAVRARFCELVAERVGMLAERSEIYLMGLFSMVDAFLDQPMERVLQDLPITDHSKNALLGNYSPYTPIYQLVLAYEDADWQRVDELAAQLGLPESSVPQLYHESLGSASNVFSV